uniref:EH domain-containing protein n=2 Tax=Fusarium oxysporum TaxID=5507 RepID=A0A0D2Y2J2_FUSOF
MNGDPSEYVLNTVVREIWKRSRLPADELAEVWDLVDRKGRGVLGRAEFVVGMWLIDQRLRGRKIPAKVSDSVWGSANGIQTKKPGHKH